MLMLGQRPKFERRIYAGGSMDKPSTGWMPFSVPIGAASNYINLMEDEKSMLITQQPSRC